MSKLKKLITEMHHRSLWQVLLIYVGAAWACFELIDTVAERLGLPVWLPGLAIVLFLLGLPFVVATACIRETPTPSTDKGHPAEGSSVGAGREIGARRRRFLTWRNAGLSFVIALAVWGIVATGWMLFGGSATVARMEAQERPSVAALPFVNRSGLEEDVYFTDGFHDEILTQLSKIGGLSVRARTSVTEYRDSPKNARQIGEELNARYILEGGVQRAGGTVRINVQLVDSKTDEHLWAETYDRPLTVENMLAVQREVAERVAEALAVRLTQSERIEIERQVTTSLEAYDYYLKGNEYFGRSYAENDYWIALQMYKKAVELDPHFAVAWAMLSRVHSGLYWERFDRTEERLAQAAAAVQEAFRVSPDLPAAHVALGYLYYWGHLDYSRALEELETARVNMSGNSDLAAALGFVQRRQGKWEDAADNLSRALELDPRNVKLTYDLAVTYVRMRRYPDAMRYLERAIALRPDWADPYHLKSVCYLLWHGNVDSAGFALREAMVAIQRMHSRRSAEPGASPTWPVLLRLFHEDYANDLNQLKSADFPSDVAYFTFKGRLSALTGERAASSAFYDSARAVLETMVLVDPNDAALRSQLGAVYAGLDRREEAIRETRLAVELMPVTREAMAGSNRVLGLAEVYVTVGEYDAAIEQLDQALSAPCYVSVPLLRVDPLWAPLRDHPRFQALLDKYDKRR